jgi:hypothetical protein
MQGITGLYDDFTGLSFLHAHRVVSILAVELPVLVKRNLNSFVFCE